MASHDKNLFFVPKTAGQEAEIAAYIARECERIQATWTQQERRKRCGGLDRVEVPVRVFTASLCGDGEFVELRT